MLDELYPEERRQEILKRVGQQGRVSVTELSQQFGVSEVTVRNDLQALAERSLIVRTHGGAVLANPSPLVPSLAIRRLQQPAEKDRIGFAAAALVCDGDAIILDSSSTTLAIAQRLKNHHDLTLITNSLAIAQEMLDAPGVTLVMPGGTVRRETASLVGPDGVDFLHKYNVQRGFFGAHGLSIAEGLTDVSAPEAELKRALVALCRQVIAVLDATKWGRVGVASFASLSQVHQVITDAHAPAELVRQVCDLGIDIKLV
jgi:DeoR/GlpR family transcriptional regulator of sugar metabolism